MAQEAASVLVVDAARARRLLLAQAVDESDEQGRFLSAVEREQLEREAVHAVTGGEPMRTPDPRAYLDERARRVVEVLRRRDPPLAALERAEPWQRWLGWGLPLVALALGAMLERIDNPEQVNMLSPPLLAFLLWNLLIYAGLLLAPLWRRGRQRRGPGGVAAVLRDWIGPGTDRRRRQVRSAIAARFHLHWWRVAGTLEGWRIARILHLSSAAWAIGVGLSIVLGGLVREYRVGWESTLLDVSQVHTLLRVIFAPVVAVLPLEGFTLADLERMHFRSGAAVGQAEARHWIALYLGLLGLVVVVPRSLLASYAGLRRRWLARALPIDLGDAYYAQVLARVSPARVTLAWAASTEPQREMLRRLWAEASAEPGGTMAASATIDRPARSTPLRTDRGDELIAVEFAPLVDAAQAHPQPQTGAPAIDAPTASSSSDRHVPARWFGRLQSWWAPRSTELAVGPQRPHADLWLVALSSREEWASIAPQLQGLPRPVLLLLDAPTQEEAIAVRTAAEVGRVPVEPLSLRANVACWAYEEPLRAAIARHLPSHQAAGGQRLLVDWRARHEARLLAAMAVLAEPLVQAAGDAQAIGTGPVGWRRIVDANERETSVQAREQAMAQLMQRLARSHAQSIDELRRMHGLPPAPPEAAQGWDADRFVVRQSVDASQAGMAGAASGAAAGVGIDLITGGLSLGAGAALGALVGGGAAFVAAALRNRGTPGGGSQVQLSDPMLQALCELSLLQYVAVAWRGTRSDEALAAWRTEVVAVVAAYRDALELAWQHARRPVAAADKKMPGEVAGLMADMAREVLERLQPE